MGSGSFVTVQSGFVIVQGFFETNSDSFDIIRGGFEAVRGNFDMVQGSFDMSGSFDMGKIFVLLANFQVQNDFEETSGNKYVT